MKAKAISYKNKKLLNLFIFETCYYSEYVLRLQKERQTWQKLNINKTFKSNIKIFQNYLILHACALPWTQQRSYMICN